MRGTIIARGWSGSSCLQRSSAFLQRRRDPVGACATGIGETLEHTDYSRVPNVFDYRQLTGGKAKQCGLDQADGDPLRESSQCELTQ